MLKFRIPIWNILQNLFFRISFYDMFHQWEDISYFLQHEIYVVCNNEEHLLAEIQHSPPLPSYASQFSYLGFSSWISENNSCTIDVEMLSYEMITSNIFITNILWLLKWNSKIEIKFKIFISNDLLIFSTNLLAYYFLMIQLTITEIINFSHYHVINNDKRSSFEFPYFQYWNNAKLKINSKYYSISLR